jgi:IclR family pca regulon transcriptional regulator
VIEAFSDDHPRLTATEAGERAGLTRTAARRYLVSLVHFGYADSDGKHYWLLPRVLRLGQSYLEAARLPRQVQPFLQRMSVQTGETGNLSVLDGHDVVSAGYASLSTFSKPKLDAWIASHDFGTYTQYTIDDPERFRDAVARARDLGYAFTDQYLNLGLRGLAVPLRDRRGRYLGALSMTIQTQDYPNESFLDRLLPALQEAAQAIRAVS